MSTIVSEHSCNWAPCTIVLNAIHDAVQKDDADDDDDGDDNDDCDDCWVQLIKFDEFLGKHRRHNIEEQARNAEQDNGTQTTVRWNLT